jgi:hypothetical protein
VLRQNVICVKIKTIRRNSPVDQARWDSSVYGVSSASADCIRRRSQRKAHLYLLLNPWSLSLVMSGGSVVAVVQSTQSRLRNHNAPISGLNSPSRSLLSKAKMGSIFMVVA